MSGKPWIKYVSSLAVLYFSFFLTRAHLRKSHCLTVNGCVRCGCLICQQTSSTWSGRQTDFAVQRRKLCKSVGLTNVRRVKAVDGSKLFLRGGRVKHVTKQTWRLSYDEKKEQVVRWFRPGRLTDAGALDIFVQRACSRLHASVLQLARKQLQHSAAVLPLFEVARAFAMLGMLCKRMLYCGGKPLTRTPSWKTLFHAWKAGRWLTMRWPVFRSSGHAAASS